MGFLAKKKTQRLMSPDQLDTTLTPEEVLDVVSVVVDVAPAPTAGIGSRLTGTEWRYRIEHNAEAGATTIAQTSYKIKTGEKDESGDRFRILVSTEPAADTRNHVTIVTTEASTYDDKILDKKSHEHVREALIAELCRRDPATVVLRDRLSK